LTALRDTDVQQPKIAATSVTIESTSRLAGQNITVGATLSAYSMTGISTSDANRIALIVTTISRMYRMK
jgi:hypothetical protein